jgi:hypothetical protein
MCLRFQICTHQRVCILHFLKKNQIRCTLLDRPAVPQPLPPAGFHVSDLAKKRIGTSAL